MMYNNKIAVAIKVNGKVLREFKDKVYLKFGSEYSILIKNLNSVRAIFNIKIDGQDVVPGGLVLNANQEIDLERWIKNGNLTTGNKFKFIERTGDIENHRGIKLEDGLIQIDIQFEKVYPQLDHYYHKIHNYPSWPNTFYPNQSELQWSSTCRTGTARSTMSASLNNITASASSTAVHKADTRSLETVAASAQLSTYNDAGITVPGSKSDQKFTTASWFPTETEKHVMILKLLGETPDNKPVVAPVTVKSKPRCQTCGTQNKATNKFCHKCGTSLEIFA